MLAVNFSATTQVACAGGRFVAMTYVSTNLQGMRLFCGDDVSTNLLCRWLFCCNDVVERVDKTFVEFNVEFLDQT